MGAAQYAGVARVGPTWRSGRDHSTEVWSARIKSALPDLKPAAGAITWYWPPEHCAPGRPLDEARPRDVHCGNRHCLHRQGAGDRSSNQVCPSASFTWGIARVAAMFWIYWDTFWSLFFSAIWFMTIVSHPDTEITG